MFWVCGQNCVDVRDGFVTAEQGPPKPRAVVLPLTIPPAGRLEVHKKLEGDTAGTADPTDPRDVPYHKVSCSALTLSNLKLGEEEGREEHF